jgi:nucleoside-diphosphate-sugar epimerase
VRVIVAGGAGFIGSHLCDRLLADGNEVVAVDNLVTGRGANLAHLQGAPGFELIVHDVVDPLDVDGPVDAVLHLASPASPTEFAQMPIEILDAGSLATRNLLELAVGHGARFLLASTSEVYGDPAVHPQPESYWGNVDPIGPRGCYDEAKRFAEALTMAFQRMRGADVRIARIFNTYGTRMRLDDGRVLTNFCAQALLDLPLTLYGDGLQTRSFCHVSDLVDGLVRLLWSDVRGPVNIGNPVEGTIMELARLIVRLSGSNSEIVTVPLPAERAGDPARRRPDISRAETLLGWRPAVELEEGVGEMIAEHRDGLGQLPGSVPLSQPGSVRAPAP